MNTLVLSGVKSIKTEEIPKPNRDYAILLIGSLKGKYIPETFDDEEQNEMKYYIQVERLDSLTDIKEHKEVKVQKGKTKSQIWRFIVEKEIGEYDKFMDWLIANQEKIFELYKSNL